MVSAYQIMIINIRDYIRNLNQLTSERERMTTELNIAHGIQNALLMRVAPFFEENPVFDIYATMHPAKEVGGDFYDVFYVDEDHLALVIADVSGKGIAAALFMMMSKTLIKLKTQSGLSPAEIFRSVNDTICDNNEAEMFVTAWLGILDLKTGTMRCVNAGHEYPMLMRAGKTFGIYKDRHGLVLGGISGMSYKEYEISLKPGDKIFLYTDGATEAMNRKGELYGIQRLLDSLNHNGLDSSKNTLEACYQDVMEYTGDAPQFDDVTMLEMCIK